MVAMMVTIQAIGVEPEDANRFSSRIMRISHQPSNPSFVEMFGCGSIVNAANHVLRNLNVCGLCAFLLLQQGLMVRLGISQRHPTACKNLILGRRKSLLGLSVALFVLHFTDSKD